MSKSLALVAALGLVTGLSAGSVARAGATPAGIAGIAGDRTPAVPVAAVSAEVAELGDQGPDVERLQRRLRNLHYWVGPIDGNYGLLMQQAVYAFEKVQGLPIDGAAGPEVARALDNPKPASPRGGPGTVWEIDKTRQVLMLVRDGRVHWIWNTSTGTETTYMFQGQERVADTPTGTFSVTWEVDGWRDGAMGRLWRPKYFHPHGIAIHGYHDVPPRPASHGCVRVTPAAMDFIWALGLAPVGATVSVYGTAPV
jgi:peptidoglycan hydrolase-like protein with peptidoglycan-binding domain